MYARTDLTLDDRLEIFSRYWRFSDDYGTVSHPAEEFRTSRQFIYLPAPGIVHPQPPGLGGDERR